MNPFFEYTDYEQANWEALANSEPELVAMVPCANADAFAVDSDGWGRLSPYGDLPHTRGIQRLDRDVAEQLVSHFKSVASRIKRAIVGMPIYKGHPDNQDFANVHTDKTRYGSVSGLEAREDGLYWRPVLTEEGAELVESGLEFPSVNWLCAPLANRVFEPRIVQSVGLTKDPNLDSQSLSNEIPDDPGQTENPKTKDNTMPTWLLEILGLAPEATEEEVKAKLAELVKKAQASSEKPEPDAEMANEVAQAKATIAKIEEQLKGVTEELANERKKTRDKLVADALEDGRILANEKDDWTRRLEKDFEAESKALANAVPLIDGKRRTDGIKPGAQGSNRVDEINSIVRKRMNDTGEKYSVAFANCEKDPAHAKLFES